MRSTPKRTYLPIHLLTLILSFRGRSPKNLMTKRSFASLRTTKDLPSPDVSTAGYGNPISNYNGTVGTLNAAILTSPFAFCGFNPYMITSSIYGCNPFNYEFYGTGMSGGYNSCGLGVPSFFSPASFYC